MMKKTFFAFLLITSVQAEELSPQDVFAKAKAHASTAVKPVQSFPGLKKWEARQLLPPKHASLDNATTKMDATQKFELAMKIQQDNNPVEMKAIEKKREALPVIGKRELLLKYAPKQETVGVFEQGNLFEIANLKPKIVAIKYGADNSKKGIEMLQLLQMRAKIITAYLPKSTIIKEYYAPDMEANSVKLEY